MVRLSAEMTRTKPKYLQCSDSEYLQRVLKREPERDQRVPWETLGMLDLEGI